MELVMEGLSFTPEVERQTSHIYDRISKVVDERQWRHAAPYILEINRLKKEKNAVILAHNYQTPDIFYGVADIVGDSLKLAQEATKTPADIILQAGVYFMAETSKILNPQKTVLIPDLGAGCSLASSITAADVRLLRETHPGVPIISYVNTSAEVKAESDICVTSGNAVQIVERLGVPEVIFLPDEYLAKYVATKVKTKILMWKGHCEVHEKFSPEYIRELRAENPGLVVIAHPECAPDVIAASDFAGSTAQMSVYLEKEKPARVVMITECSMSENLYATNPSVEIVRPCQLCPHMQRITLPKILHSLQTMTNLVEVDAEISARARKAIDRMLELS